MHNDVFYDSGFPLVKYLNNLRINCFNHSFNFISPNIETNKKRNIKINSFSKCISHHLLTPLCLLVNFTAIVTGITGITALSCISKIFKATNFIFKFKNINPNFSPGFEYLRERIFYSTYHILCNLGHLIIDTWYFYFKIKYLICYIVRIFKIDFIIEKIYNKIIK